MLMLKITMIFYCGKLCIFLYFHAIIYILLAQQVT